MFDIVWFGVLCNVVSQPPGAASIDWLESWTLASKECIVTENDKQLKLKLSLRSKVIVKLKISA